MAAFRFYTDSSNGYDDHQQNRRQKQRLPICLNQIFHLKKKKDKNVDEHSTCVKIKPNVFSIFQKFFF